MNNMKDSYGGDKTYSICCTSDAVVLSSTGAVSNTEHTQSTRRDGLAESPGILNGAKVFGAQRP
jgi:hypothetical protein